MLIKDNYHESAPDVHDKSKIPLLIIDEIDFALIDKQYTMHESWFVLGLTASE